MGDYYETLGVPRTASKSDIRAAFLVLMRDAHPDMVGGDDIVAKRLNEAYDVLSKSGKRAAYDDELSAAAEALRPEAERRANKSSGARQSSVYIPDEWTVTPPSPAPAPQPRATPMAVFDWPDIDPWRHRTVVRTAWAIWGVDAIVVLLAFLAVSWGALIFALPFVLALSGAAYCFGTRSPILGAFSLLCSLLLAGVLILLRLQDIDVEQVMIDGSLAEIPQGRLVAVASVVLLFVLSIAIVLPAIVLARRAEAGDWALAALDEFRHVHEHAPHLGLWEVKAATAQDPWTAVDLEAVVLGESGRRVSTILEGAIQPGDLLLLNETSHPVRRLPEDVFSRAKRREDRLN